MWVQQMMNTLFNCVAELDIGQEASAAVTSQYYQELFYEVLAVGNYVILLGNEITSLRDSPPPIERIDVREHVSNNVLARLSKQAQKGFRMAVVMPDARMVIKILESRGYIRCTNTSSGSAMATQGWIAWLEQYAPDAQGVLVFGHDYEPAFVFEKIVAKEPVDTD